MQNELLKYGVPETESSSKKGRGGGSETGKYAKRGKGRGQQRSGGKNRANCVKDDDEYAFSVYDKCVLSVDSGTVQLKVGGAIIKGVLIDSGASCNVVDKETWEDLQSQGIKCESEKGIGPTEEKVKAVSDVWEPESVSEVQSFLGLVNFCA